MYGSKIVVTKSKYCFIQRLFVHHKRTPGALRANGWSFPRHTALGRSRFQTWTAEVLKRGKKPFQPWKLSLLWPRGSLTWKDPISFCTKLVVWREKRCIVRVLAWGLALLAAHQSPAVESALVNENSFYQEPNEKLQHASWKRSLFFCFFVCFFFFLKPGQSRPRKGKKKALFIASLLDFSMGRKKKQKKCPTDKKGHLPIHCHKAGLHDNAEFACVLLWVRIL